MISQVPKPFLDMGESLKFNLKNGHIIASLILMYSYINAMASMMMQEGQKEVTGDDFKKWVDTYMKADSDQAYQYQGVDLWGARCGLVHRYSAYSSLSESAKCKVFQYYSGDNHKYDPSSNKNVVVISATRIVSDFYGAMINFADDLLKNENLRDRANKRFQKYFLVTEPIKPSLFLRNP